MLCFPLNASPLFVFDDRHELAKYFKWWNVLDQTVFSGGPLTVPALSVASSSFGCISSKCFKQSDAAATVDGKVDAFE